jgi:hypothetical protein
MAKDIKVDGKTSGVMPGWLQGVITAGIFIIIGLLTSIQINTNRLAEMPTTLTNVEGHTGQLSEMNEALVRVEEHTKDIGSIRSGMDKLLGKFGIAEITPTNGGTITVGDIVINVPPNSVSEPTWVTVEKIPASNLPAIIPSKYYVYSDGFKWSAENNLSGEVTVSWDLIAGLECGRTKILYWDDDISTWQEVPTGYCSTVSGLVAFGAKSEGYYVLAEEKTQ